MIDLNITLLIQLVNFLIVLVGLNALLIRPIREIIKQRQDKMSGLLGDSEQFTSAADEKLTNYETALADARAAAVAERDAIKEEGLTAEAEIVSNATKAAQDKMSASREQIRADVEQAMEVLKGQVGALADKATAKVLG